ncbi:hypothetical protein RSAG8_09228, partial [Rhizoctonia solani AG-8 WAC10335]
MSHKSSQQPRSPGAAPGRSNTSRSNNPRREDYAALDREFEEIINLAEQLQIKARHWLDQDNKPTSTSTANSEPIVCNYASMLDYKGTPGKRSHKQRPKLPRPFATIEQKKAELIQKGEWLPEETIKSRRKEGQCLKCGKQGHLIRHCPEESYIPDTTKEDDQISIAANDEMMVDTRTLEDWNDKAMQEDDQNL